MYIDILCIITYILLVVGGIVTFVIFAGVSDNFSNTETNDYGC